MQTFYKNTIESKFIKNLIATFPIPTVEVFNENTKPYKGSQYIKDGNIIEITDVKGTTYNYKNLTPFTFGEEYKCFTSTYKSPIESYDSETHALLGYYLRSFRDIKNIDLMPFYNCFNNQYIDNIDFIEGKPEIIDYNEDYNIISIPAVFNKEYTIAIDCGSPIEIMNVLYGPRGLINIYGNSEDKSPNYKYTTINNSSFKKPFIYKTTQARELTYPYLRYLKIFIKLPRNNKSSIVVLEGDYTKIIKSNLDNPGSYISNSIKEKVKYPEDSEKSLICYKSIIDISEKKYNSNYINKYLLSPLELLQLNDGNNYAFSNTLISYLLENVVTSSETIENNIKTLQKNLNLNENGIWDNNLRIKLFEKAMLSNTLRDKLDINGFEDKKIESIIGVK